MWPNREVVNPAIQHIGGRVVAAGATRTALTMNTGDSNIVPFSNGRPFLVDQWVKVQAVGVAATHAQQMANDTDGFRYNTIIGDPFQTWPQRSMNQLFNNQTVNYELSGSAVAGDFDLMANTLYFFNADGINQKLIHYSEALARKVQDLTWSFSVTGGAGGGYTGEVLMSTGLSVITKPHTNYAVIGGYVNTPCCSVVFKGVDTSQTRVGFPANGNNKEVTRDFFIRKSMSLDLPYIITINSDNITNTTIGVMCDENGGTFLINLLLWELS